MKVTSPILLKRLERLAFEDGIEIERNEDGKTGKPFFRVRPRSEDLKMCLARLCTDLSEVEYRPKDISKSAFEDARAVAHYLFYNAACVVEPPVENRRRGRPSSMGYDAAKKAILQAATDCMTESVELPSSRPTSHDVMRRPALTQLGPHFGIRAIVDGRPRLDVVGKRGARPCILVAYAFWKIAVDADPKSWRRYVLRKCPACNRYFYDTRDRMAGKRIKYCRSRCDRRIKASK